MLIHQHPKKKKTNKNDIEELQGHICCLSFSLPTLARATSGIGSYPLNIIRKTKGVERTRSYHLPT